MLGLSTIITQLTGMVLVTKLNLLRYLCVVYQQVKGISYVTVKGLTVWMEVDEKTLVAFLWH